MLEAPAFPGVQDVERPGEEVADHRRGLLVADGVGERRGVALEVVDQLAAPLLVVAALGGLDSCHHSAVLAHLGREQRRERDRCVPHGLAPHGRDDGLLGRSDGRTGRHQLAVVGWVLARVGGWPGPVLLDAGQEPVHPGLRRREEEQCRTARVTVPPDGVLAVAAVPGHLRPQACLVHRGEVDLDERAGHAVLAVDVEVDLGVGVGADAPGAPIARPVLPGVLVPAPLAEGEPDRGAGVEEGDVEAGDRRGVAQEQRVGRALARRGRGALYEACAGTGQPPVERRRAQLRVRTGPVHERALTQPGEAVVDGPFRTTGEGDELRRRQRSVDLEQSEDVVVDRAEPIDPRRYAAAPVHRRPPSRRRSLTANLPLQSGSFEKARLPA